MSAARLVPCPTCDRQVATTAVACPGCGMPNPGVATQKTTENIVGEVLGDKSRASPSKSAARIAAEKESQQKGQFAGAIIVLLVVLAFMWTCNSCGSSDEPDRSASAATSAPLPSTGDPVRLRLPGSSGALLVATTEDSFERLNDALVAKDTYDVTEILMSGQAFSVDSGTEAILLDPGFLKSKVRVTSGPMAGQAGWVAREFAVAR